MPTPTEIANATGKTEAYARMVMAGTRSPSLRVALRIYDELGVRYGPLASLTPKEIATARKMAKAA
jgi:hypothetical protein